MAETMTATAIMMCALGVPVGSTVLPVFSCMNKGAKATCTCTAQGRAKLRTRACDHDLASELPNRSRQRPNTGEVVNDRGVCLAAGQQHWGAAA